MVCFLPSTLSLRRFAGADFCSAGAGCRFHADLLAIRDGGNSGARRAGGWLAGGEADLPVSSVGQLRARPGARKGIRNLITHGRIIVVTICVILLGIWFVEQQKYYSHLPPPPANTNNTAAAQTITQIQTPFHPSQAWVRLPLSTPARRNNCWSPNARAR